MNVYNLDDYRRRKRREAYARAAAESERCIEALPPLPLGAHFPKRLAQLRLEGLVNAIRS